MRQYYRSCQLNPPRRHGKVIVRGKLLRGSEKELRGLLRILRKAIDRRAVTAANSASLQTVSEPIQLGRYLFLRRGRLLPARRLVALHSFYRSGQRAVRLILDSITRLEPYNDWYMRQHYAVFAKVEA